ncbi:MAG: cysteine synthase A [Eubacteriales bacterium]|nr:cysteine synthase A [Eubacteriales bacterium]MDD4323329.1 cysteine synthase A [Eubacteriales bacterium]MDD4540644.1 cysteine synthase A [Eubacteriales bacterium]
MRKKNFAASIEELINDTPLYHPQRWLRDQELPDVQLFCKLEYYNPTGSVKDRTALGMILDLEEKGLLQEGGTIIEPTSGNTGIGAAAIAAARGYRTIIILPDSMSLERRNLLKAYGAELILTPGAEGMKAAISKAQSLLKEIPASVSLGQFVNQANPAYHEKTTGVEIWRDCPEIDVFVSGVGTGGTLTGVARAIRKQKTDLEVVAVEPDTSAVLSGEPAGKHGIQGIGAGFVPDTMDLGLVDRILKVSSDDAAAAARAFVRSEGLLLGISSGAALSACLSLLRDPNYAAKTIVTILPDSGDRYLSTGIYNQE